MFCNSFRGVSRDAHHFKTQLFSGVQVHVVKARAAQRDILHAVFFQLFQYRAAAIVINENTHRIAAVSRFGRFFSQQKVEKFKFEAIGLVNMLQILFIVLLCAIDREFHKTFSSDFTFTLA
jgi:hypothetical protein